MRTNPTRWQGMHIFETRAELERAAAHRMTEALTDALRHGAVATLVLTGGRTAQGVYGRLAQGQSPDLVDWSRVHVFWGDERVVPPESPDSNFRMAKRTLLAHLAVSEANVHRIAGERAPERAAARYEEEIRQVLGSGLPRFDVVLLSMGEDGHVASLFPGTEALREQERLVIPVTGPKPPVHRVTLTLKAINAARLILVLASGTAKATALARVHRAGRGPDPRLPVSLLQPDVGNLVWMADRNAASELNHHVTTSG